MTRVVLPIPTHLLTNSLTHLPRTVRFWVNIRSIFALSASLILPAAAAYGDERAADAVSVFHCTFDEAWDMNFDRWPDRWVRQTGVKYPHYVSIGIQDDDTAVAKKCLKLDLDGAAAAVSSPPIRVMSRFSYVFECS